jgi:hypothetical protein
MKQERQKKKKREYVRKRGVLLNVDKNFKNENKRNRTIDKCPLSYEKTKSHAM